MSSSIIDSKIFGDMFSDAAMRHVWSDENRTVILEALSASNRQPGHNLALFALPPTSATALELAHSKGT